MHPPMLIAHALHLVDGTRIVRRVTFADKCDRWFATTAVNLPHIGDRLMREPARLLSLLPGIVEAPRTILAAQQSQSALQPSCLSLQQQYQQPIQQPIQQQ